MKVMFLGDTHGNVAWMQQVAAFAAERDVDLIIQLGDWGFWWPGHDKDNRLHTILSQIDIPMWFIDGNHDNHPRLRKIVDKDGYISPYLRYLKRGTRFELDGWRFLALGGAYSIDKMYRTEGRSWWREEEISYAEAMQCIEDGPCDVMLTHDKPLGVKLSWDRKDIPECWPNQKTLQEVAFEVQPKWLFHGHVHWRQTSTLALPGGKLCRVESLNCDFPKGEYGDTRPPSDSFIIKDLSELKSITADGALARRD